MKKPTPHSPRTGSLIFVAAWLLCVVGAWCGVAAAGAADSAKPPTTQSTHARLNQQLQAIDHRAADIHDLTAKFEQRKYSPLLRDPLITRGRVLVKPPVMLWVSDSPEPTRMQTDGQTLRIYYVKRDVVEVYPVNGPLAALTASPLPRLSAMRKLFRFSNADAKGLPPAPKGAHVLVVRLDPIDAKLTKHVDHVRVMLDADRGLMLALEITDPDGERTVVRFTSIHVNVALKNKALELNLPAGVKVVHPLVGERKNQPRMNTDKTK